MNPIFRFLVVLFWARFSPRIGVGDVTRVRMRTWPNDLDLNLHMTNARYLALLDIAGMDFAIRVGLSRLIIRRGRTPLIGGRIIRHRFGVRPFERFTVITRLLFWDEKWFYVDQRMETKRGTAAIVLTKSLVHSSRRAGAIQPQELLASIGVAATPPAPGPEVVQWLAADKMLRAQDDC